jgi:molybdopterin-containing oxidoreductase family membrane subunit
MSLLWFYFTFSEFLTAFFGSEPHEMEIVHYKFTGPFAPYFWTMVLCNFLIPVVVLAFKRFKTIKGVLFASIAVIIGMWLERLIIVVPSLANPRLELPVGIYVPTLVEWALFIGGISVFALGFMLFAKFFPLISIWEIEEGREHSLKEVEARVQAYLPDQDSLEGPATQIAPLNT